MWVLSTDPAVKNRPVQDGVKERLLCSECEQKRSKWETYFSNLWHRGQLFGRGPSYQLDRLDYKRTKLFLMSTLFMAHFSNDPLFHDIELADESVPVLRRLLANSDPGEPHEYGCVISRLEETGLDTRTLIGKATTIIIQGARLHRFLFGGFFLSFIDSDGLPIDKEVSRLYITKQGELTVREKQLRDLHYLMGSFKSLGSS